MAGPLRRIPKWILFTIFSTQEGSQRVNTFSYAWTGSTTAPTVTQLNAMAQNFWTAVGTLYTTMLCGNVNVQNVETRWLDPLGPPIVGGYTVPQPHPGTSPGNATPANAAVVLSWRTGLAGRAYRGRTYLPGIGESSQVNSTVNSSYITAATALANALVAFNNGGGIVGVQMVVASFVKQLLNQILFVVIDNAIDSQRKRLIGRGR